jgi:hypothetical protein
MWLFVVSYHVAQHDAAIHSCFRDMCSHASVTTDPYPRSSTHVRAANGRESRKCLGSFARRQRSQGVPLCDGVAAESERPDLSCSACAEPSVIGRVRTVQGSALPLCLHQQQHARERPPERAEPDSTEVALVESGDHLEPAPFGQRNDRSVHHPQPQIEILIGRMRQHAVVPQVSPFQLVVYEHVGSAEIVVTSAAQSAAKVTVRSLRPLAR